MLAGKCLTIAAALAVNMPAYVRSEIYASQLLACQWAQSEHMVPDAAAPDLLHCSMPGLRALQDAAESPSESTSVLHGFAALQQALLSAGMESVDIKVSTASIAVWSSTSCISWTRDQANM